MGNETSNAAENDAFDAYETDELTHFYILLSQFVNDNFRQAIQTAFEAPNINITDSNSFIDKLNTNSDDDIISSNTMKEIAKRVNLNSNQINYLLNLMRVSQYNDRYNLLRNMSKEKGNNYFDMYLLYKLNQFISSGHCIDQQNATKEFLKFTSQLTNFAINR